MNQGSGATVAGKMLIAILIVFFATGVSFPTDLQSGLFELPPSLKSLIDAAIAENESIKQMEAEFEAIKAEEPSAKALDDPRLTLGINALPVDTFSFNQEPMTQKQIVVSQRFPLNILMNGKLLGEIEFPETLKIPPAIPSREKLVNLAMVQNPKKISMTNPSFSSLLSA